LTWKEYLIQEIKISLEAVECEGIIGEELKQTTDEGGHTVIEFALVHEKKSFGIDKIRVFTTFMRVETNFEDAEYLKVLTRKEK